MKRRADYAGGIKRDDDDHQDIDDGTNETTQEHILPLGSLGFDIKAPVRDVLRVRGWGALKALQFLR
eukprot:4283645-Pyramimonas_sp.AAC.1